MCYHAEFGCCAAVLPHWDWVAANPTKYTTLPTFVTTPNLAVPDQTVCA